MAEVVRLMGVESRSYEKDGQQRTFTGLHVVYELDDGAEDSLSGKKCDNFSCPREVNPGSLKIGARYALEYAHFKTKNGLGARICGLEQVDL